MKAPEWWSWYWGLDWTERHAWTALAVGVVAGIVLTAFSHESRIVLGLFLAAILFVVVLLGIFPRVFPNSYLREWDHRDSRFVDQVMGAFFLVRRRVFEELHGFDQRFFVYFEDVDFSCRSHQADWSSYYLATVRAFHKGEGCTEKVKAARLFYSLRSRILYAYKHFSWAGATSVLLTTTLVEPFTRLGWAILRGTLVEFNEILRGYWKLWREAPRLIAESRSRTTPTGAV